MFHVGQTVRWVYPNETIWHFGIVADVLPADGQGGMKRYLLDDGHYAYSPDLVSDDSDARPPIRNGTTDTGARRTSSPINTR